MRDANIPKQQWLRQAAPRPRRRNLRLRENEQQDSFIENAAASRICSGDYTISTVTTSVEAMFSVCDFTGQLPATHASRYRLPTMAKAAAKLQVWVTTPTATERINWRKVPAK